MLSWFRIVKLGFDERGAVLAPKQPTFAWANTSYYARELAARHFGVSAQDMIVTPFRDTETFPKHAVELVETDGVVEQRPLRQKVELRVAPERLSAPASRRSNILRIARAILIPPLKCSERKRKRKAAKVSKKCRAKR